MSQWLMQSRVSWIIAIGITLVLNACGGTDEFFPITDYWETENNNSSNQADVMPIDYRSASDEYDYTGSVASADNSDDWYQLETTQPGHLSVSLTCTDLTANDTINMTLYDSSLNELDSPSMGTSSGGTVTASSSAGDPAEVYYVRIDSGSWPHRYDLNSNFVSGSGLLQYWESANNNSNSQADFIPLDYRPTADGYDYTGAILANDVSVDWYQISTTQPGQLSVTLICDDLSDGEQVNITLNNSLLNQLDAVTLLRASGGAVTANTSTGVAAGVYYVRVDSNSWPHNYDLVPRFTSADTEYSYWEIESNDSNSQAEVMSLWYNPNTDGYDFTGAFTPDDSSDDWYRFTTTQPGQLSVILACDDLALSENVFITLYNANLVQLDESSLYGMFSDSVTVWSSTLAPAGIYFVRIDSASWPHQYNLTPVFTP